MSCLNKEIVAEKKLHKQRRILAQKFLLVDNFKTDELPRNQTKRMKSNLF